VEVKQKKVLPPVKAKLTENKEYVGNVTWPTIEELTVSNAVKAQYEDWYKIGMNRQRQKAHGDEVPTVRYPDLIITGAKKCGTTALKIFMNYHTWFQDTPGERHFFNRPTNWAKGYQWYHDQMPLTFKDEICYEKTPDYFDRPFIPERISKLENSKNIKFVHVLCDPVRRAFSHFLHMFTVQQVGQEGIGGPQPGFEFLQENFADITKEEAFERTVELAFGNLLGKEKDIDQMTPDEIRAAVADYFTRWDLKPGSKGRVFPLRIPDAVLTGSLYSTHINTYLHYFTQDQMLYLDATELIENPGMSLRRVADFAGVPQLITEENFYFDDEKGYFCMKPPIESARESFCLGSSKGRSKDKSLPVELKRRIRKFFDPFVKDLETKFTGDNYDHWDW